MNERTMCLAIAVSKGDTVFEELGVFKL